MQIISGLLAFYVVRFGLSALFIVLWLFLFTNPKTQPFMKKALRKIFEAQNAVVLMLFKSLKDD